MRAKRERLTWDERLFLWSWRMWGKQAKAARIGVGTGLNKGFPIPLPPWAMFEPWERKLALIHWA